jgi:hypothetical protein
MFRRATEEEGNAAVNEAAAVIARWMYVANRISLTPGAIADLGDILQQKLGDMLGVEEGEI